MNAYMKEIAALRDRVAYLESETEYLRDILRPKVNPFADKLGFSPQQAVFAYALFRCDIATYDYLDEVAEAYCHAIRAEDDKRISIRVKVAMFKVRHKLRQHGIEVLNIRGVGYKINPQDKPKMLQLAEGKQ